LKARGVEDILITATDNLNGFTQIIVLFSPNPKRRFVWFIRLEMPVNMWFGKTEKRFLRI